MEFESLQPGSTTSAVSSLFQTIGHNYKSNINQTVDIAALITNKPISNWTMSPILLTNEHSHSDERQNKYNIHKHSERSVVELVILEKPTQLNGKHKHQQPTTVAVFSKAYIQKDRRDFATEYRSQNFNRRQPQPQANRHGYNTHDVMKQHRGSLGHIVQAPGIFKNKQYNAQFSRARKYEIGRT